MQTYTHFVMTALLGRQLRQQSADDAAPSDASVDATTPIKLWGGELPPLARGPLLIGSFMPDLPLTLWTIVYIVMDWANGARWNPDEPGASLVGALFDDMFFNDPWVKAAHNLFHAPILTVAYTLLGYWLWQSARKVNKDLRARWGAGLFWFGVACTIHTAIDIPIHHDDGPLLLFPFNWSLRFISPVSYWDPEHYGIPFAIFEHLLLLVMLGLLIYGWWQRRQHRQQMAT